MRYFLSILFVFVALTSTHLQAQAIHDYPIRIVTSDSWMDQEHEAVLTRSIAALKAHFGDRNIIFERLSLAQIENTVLNESAHFFFGTSGAARRTMSNGTQTLLTIKSSRFSNPNNTFGSVFITRSDSPVFSFSQMLGKRLATSRPTSFFGYMVGMGELESHGFNSDTIFSNKFFLGRHPAKIVDAVIQKQADVGLLPSCFLEDAYGPNVLETLGLRVIQRTQYKNPCLTSTESFPDWSLVAVRHTRARICKEVIQVLLRMDAVRDGGSWTVTTDPRPTDQLLRDIKTGDYSYMRHWDVAAFLSQYQGWILVFIFAVLAAFGHSVILNRTVFKKTAELQAAYERETKLLSDSQQLERRYESLQRVGSVTQMGSMIAHELRQPLTVITAYAHGLSRFIENDAISNSELQETMAKISEQAQKAEAIVEKVRSYASGTKAQRERRNLNRLLQLVLSNFKASGRFSGKVEFCENATVYSLVVPLEIELAVHNLLRNAADALNSSNTDNPTILLSIEQDQECRTVSICVHNNGSVLSQADMKRIRTPLSSTKSQGMGLGLLIIESIAVNHGGKLILQADPSGGLLATIQLPILEKE